MIAIRELVYIYTIRSHSQIVVKVTIINDARVEHFGVRLHDLIGLLRNQASRLAVLGVDYGTKITGPLTTLLTTLLTHVP